MIQQYLTESKKIIDNLNITEIEKIITILDELRTFGGRLFILGIGGSAANSSHAVNDFRKLTGIESYAATDNVAELTARINDDGWDFAYEHYLIDSNFNENDVLFILSVGGGHIEKKISANLALAVKYAKDIGAKIVGIVGRDGGYTAQNADACLIIPDVSKKNLTFHTESFQSLVLHLMVAELQIKPTKWRD